MNSASSSQPDDSLIKPSSAMSSMNNNLLVMNSDSDSCSSSQKSEPLASTTTNIKKIEIGSQSLEKEDKQRVNTVRTQFYALNEKFEQLLKFKPLLKVHLMQTEMHMPASYNIF